MVIQWLGIRLPMWIGVYFGNPTQGDGGPARERGKWRNVIDSGYISALMWSIRK